MGLCGMGQRHGDSGDWTPWGPDPSQGQGTPGTRPLLSSWDPLLQAVDVLAAPCAPSPHRWPTPSPAWWPPWDAQLYPDPSPLQRPHCGAPQSWRSRHPCLPLVQGGTATCPPSPSQTTSQPRSVPNPAAGPASSPALHPHVLGEPCATSRSLAPPNSPPPFWPLVQGRPQGWELPRTPEAHADPTVRPGAGMGPGIATSSSGAASRRAAGLRVLAPIRHGSTPALAPITSCTVSPAAALEQGRGQEWRWGHVPIPVPIPARVAGRTWG